MARKRIMEELGMSKEEFLRIKFTAGLPVLFKNHKYSKAWLTRKQLEINKREKDSNKKEM